MLTISKPLSAAQAAKYHDQEYRNVKQNYYAEGDRIEGRWYGRLATEFGLDGPVQMVQFARLAEGQHPTIDGFQLIRTVEAHSYVNANGATVHAMPHRAGWDATFSAPKSVSLVALVGGDDRVRAAHRQSVEVALQELEVYTQARLGGARLPETTSRFAAAAFEHDSARPVNGYAAPQLHTHVVVFNMTRTSRDRFRSIQPRELYKSQALATAVYRAELGRRLRELGYEIDRGKSGQPEITGFSREYLEAASPRRRQIQELLEAHGRGGAEAAEIAAHQTRDAKIPHGKEEVQRQHQEMAEAFGNQPHRAVAAARGRQRHVVVDPADVMAAMEYSKQRNMERSAVVDERHFVTDALKRGMGDVTLQDVRREFVRRHDVGEFLPRQSAQGAAARVWTTPEMVALEQATIDRLRQGQQLPNPMVPELARQRVRSSSLQTMTAEQRAAVQQILASHDQVVALDGIAGSGKTTAIAAIRVAAEQSGYFVHGLAPTSRAAALLADAGIYAETLQRHIARAQTNDQTPRLTVLDESSLASTVLMKTFLDRMRPQDRVLLVGDIRQHQSVDAGKSYEQLQDHGLETAKLTQIVRQRDPQLKAVVEQLAAGQVKASIDALSAMGKVHVIPERTARLAAVARAVVEDPQRTLVVCPDNQSRQEINGAIHRALQMERSVQEDCGGSRVLVTKHDLTGTDRAYADRYDVGDTIRYTKGSQAQGISAGQYATVVRRDRETNALTVQLNDGRLITYDPRRLRGVSVYEEETRAFAVGDRVQFTAPSRDLRVANRQLGTVLALNAGNVRIRLDTGREVRFPLASHPHLDFGYAVTSHSGQGQTADRVIVHIDNDRSAESIVNRRLAYVALSRGRYDAAIYADNADALSRNLSREVSKRAALETACEPRRHTSNHALERSA